MSPLNHTDDLIDKKNNLLLPHYRKMLSRPDQEVETSTDMK